MRLAVGPLSTCMMVAWMLGGCAKGAEGDTTLTFGPADPTPGSATTDPVDPTTGGGGGWTDDSSGPPSVDTTSAVDGSTGVSGATDPVDSTTDPTGPVCGNGIAEEGEGCDGPDLAGLSCPDVSAMFTGGTLACSDACDFDTSGCSTAANPIQVCQVVNTAITDNTLTSSVLMLPPEALGGTITDVNVRVQLVHTWIGDLQISVSSGANVLMFDRLCGSQPDLHATFDDQAGAAFNCPSSSANLSATPASPLSAFNGAAVAANWTIGVHDMAAGDTGTLQEWCLTIAWM